MNIYFLPLVSNLLVSLYFAWKIADIYKRLAALGQLLLVMAIHLDELEEKEDTP